MRYQSRNTDTYNYHTIYIFVTESGLKMSRLCNLVKINVQYPRITQSRGNVKVNFFLNTGAVDRVVVEAYIEEM